MKKCPFCAEEIQEEAKICRHCGKNVINTKRGGKIWILVTVGLILIISIAWLSYTVISTQNIIVNQNRQISTQVSVINTLEVTKVLPSRTPTIIKYNIGKSGVQCYRYDKIDLFLFSEPYTCMFGKIVLLGNNSYGSYAKFSADSWYPYILSDVFRFDSSWNNICAAAEGRIYEINGIPVLFIEENMIYTCREMKNYNNSK